MKNILSIVLSSLSLTAAALPKNSVQPKIVSFESEASGFNTKSFFVVSQGEAVVIVTQFTPHAAQLALDHFSKTEKSALKFAIATHPNPDKFNGATFFQSKGAKFVTSEATANAMADVHAYKKYFFVNMAKMFKEDEYPQLPKVDVSFLTRKILTVGNTKIELSELGTSGVSVNQTVVYVPSAKALFVGDLIHNEAHAWLEGGIVKGKPAPNLSSWIATLEVLKARYPQDTVVYGGRGDSGKLAEVVDTQIAYLKKAELLQFFI